MVQPAQAGPLLDALSRQLGLSKEELEGRARDSRISYAASLAALQDGCNCRACQLLRTLSDKVLGEAMRDITPPARPVRAELVPPAQPEPVEG